MKTNGIIRRFRLRNISTIHTFLAYIQHIWSIFSHPKCWAVFSLWVISAHFNRIFYRWNNANRSNFQILNIIIIERVIPNFWIGYTKAITALLAGDLPKWIQHSEELFPKAAKCSYSSYGPSGTIQSFDALCLLPLNILNQKIFIIVWFWFIIQLLASILSLLYWYIISNSERLRISILHEKSMKSVPHTRIFHAKHKGHFFVLNQISRNVNPLTFVDLISDLVLDQKD